MFHSPRLTWQVTFYRCAHLHGRISLTCTRKGLLPWTCVCFLCCLRYVPRKSPAYNLARKLTTRARKETNNLVLLLLWESPRKLAPRRIATPARSMGARLLHTIQDTVVSMRKMEQRKPIPMLSRKAERSPIPWSSLLHSWARNWTSLRRRSRNRAPSPRNTIGMIAIPTPNRELGRVA